MLQPLLEFDKELFLLLNGLHNEALDPVMYYTSLTKFWVPAYLVISFFLIRKYRNDSWAPLLGIFLTIAIADQTASTMMKPLFQRLRPSHEPSLQQLVHTVYGYRGAKFGFASSHAANVFGVGFFIWWALKPKGYWMALWFAWATFVSYTRIYLGVHYPLDIIAGILIGAGAAAFSNVLYQWFRKNEDRLLRRT
jgi:undecaprenyl-diphosphatase